MKLVNLDSYALNPGDLDMTVWERFGTFTAYPRTAPEDVISRIGDAEIVFTNKVVITDEIMAQCTRLKYIGVMATGYNVIDVHAAAKRNIVVTNIPGYGTQSVAQFTFALILAIANRVQEHSSSVYAGDWMRSLDFSYWKYPLTDLAGKTLGIIGFGAIGQAVAKIAVAMGMKVLYYSKTRKEALEIQGEINYASLDELYAASDILSLHCPLFPENQHMICKSSIDRMKKGVWIINTARGGLIKEADLAEALKSGQVGFAACDVVESEPMQKDCPYMQAPNMILTPHIAWASREARQRLLHIAVENLEAFINGTPIHVVS